MVVLRGRGETDQYPPHVDVAVPPIPFVDVYKDKNADELCHVQIEMFLGQGIRSRYQFARREFFFHTAIPHLS